MCGLLKWVSNFEACLAAYPYYHTEKKHGIIARKLTWHYTMQQSRYNTMNCCMV